MSNGNPVEVGAPDPSKNATGMMQNSHREIRLLLTGNAMSVVIPDGLRSTTRLFY